MAGDVRRSGGQWHAVGIGTPWAVRRLRIRATWPSHLLRTAARVLAALRSDQRSHRRLGVRAQWVRRVR
jgi:hypothetical protein